MTFEIHWEVIRMTNKDKVQPRQEIKFTTVRELKGIAGWLGLLGLSMVLGLFILIHSVITSISYTTFEFMLNVIVLTAWAFMMILFAKHHQWFPKFFIIIQVLIIALTWLIWIGGLAPMQVVVTQNIVSIVWICYLVRSKRVKNTFVRTDFSHKWGKNETLIGK